jgi:predicted HTH domain antitoxin
MKIIERSKISLSFYAIIEKRHQMEISVKIPEKITEHMNEPYDKFVNETLVVELYREGLFTLRQAAETLGVGLNEMLAILTKRKTYINYGTEELDEDISYARS